jgi:hypothetical protein
VSGRAYVAGAARAVVLLVAPLLFYHWALRTSFGVARIDLWMQLLASSLLPISGVPVLTRLGDPPRRDGWRIPDVLLLVGTAGLLLYILSGAGRVVLYESGGFQPGLTNAGH